MKSIILNEWKSVSDSVIKVADTVVNLVLIAAKRNDFYKLDMKLSGTPVLDGDIPLSMSDFFGNGTNPFGIDILDIHYRIALFDNIKIYNSNIEAFGSSEYDSETNKMVVRIATIKGNITNDLCENIVQEVYHELNHVFEYGNGLQKRTELYNKITGGLQSRDKIKRVVCLLSYFSFPHEQDAFAHQFYGFLKARNSFMPFDVVVQDFKYYSEFSNAISAYQKMLSKDPDGVYKAVNEIGLHHKQFEARTHFGFKRFRKKLRRVYERYSYERSNRLLTFEGELRLMGMESSMLARYRAEYGNITLLEEGTDKYQ